MLSDGGWVLLIWVQKSLSKWGQASLYPCLLYTYFRCHLESENKCRPEVLPGFLQAQLTSVVRRDQSPAAKLTVSSILVLWNPPCLSAYLLCSGLTCDLSMAFPRPSWSESQAVTCTVGLIQTCNYGLRIV